MLILRRISNSNQLAGNLQNLIGVQLKNYHSFYRTKSESYRMIDETNNKLIILVAKVGCRTNTTRKNI